MTGQCSRPDRGALAFATLGVALTFLCVGVAVCGEEGSAVDSTQLSSQVGHILEDSQSKEGPIRSQAIAMLKALIHQKEEYPEPFEDLVDNLMESIATLVLSEDTGDHEAAFHQIVMLGDLRSSRSIPLLVGNMLFRNPYITVYDRGPTSSTEPEPKDLPVFDVLLKIGTAATEAIFQKAVSENDPLVHAVCAEFLMYHYGFKGALQWLSDAERRDSLDSAMLSRLQAIVVLVEARR